MSAESPAESVSDILVLDAHTLKDLEIFLPETAEKSLFDFCNLTRTKGGEKVLRARMERPFSNAARINSTQASVSFVHGHRAMFDRLSSTFVTSRTELYMREVLPIVAQGNIIEFGFDAFSLWANHSSHFQSIVRGVQFTCMLIRTLREFAVQPELSTAKGDLEPLIAEIQQLLARPKIAEISDHETSGWAWSLLRLDQTFRLSEGPTIARLLQLIYEIDALVSMADATQKYGFVLPTVEQGPLMVQAKGLVHPFVPNPIPNEVQLDQNQRVLFLTGPNMAGKTTYLRAIASALYLAHLGMGVPASRFSFVPAERLFSSLSLNDDLRGGISYFRAEALRTKAVAQSIADGYRVIAVMDEPFKGTNVKDALDASLAILERFATKADCLFMFSSHLIELSEQLTDKSQIDCRYFEADESEGRLRFDYLLRSGVSSQRLGMRVLREEGVFDLLDHGKEAT
ncbi:MAG: DNA mismatch repair protein MutS [Candidatus Azotimanducaceae bacterium]|jgi:DNA mismatch repair protein MutS